MPSDIFKEILKEKLKILAQLPFLTIKFILSEVRELFKNFLKKLRFSIAFKFTVRYVMSLANILIFLSFAILFSLTAFLGKTAEDNMNKSLNMISWFLEDSGEIPENNIDKLSSVENITITLFDIDKKVLYTTEKKPSTAGFYDKNNSKFLTELNPDFFMIRDNPVTINNSQKVSFEDVKNFSKVSLILSKKIRASTPSGVYFIQITDNLVKEYSITWLVMKILIEITSFFIITTILSGARWSKKLLRPVDIMTKTAKNITINALDTRLNISGSQDELKDLAVTINNMLDRLQQSVEQQNEFVSDASHELRTPISVIQGYVNLLDRWGKNDHAVLEEAITAIKTESENMKELIEKLLFLARSDKNTQKVEKTDFYINELIDEVVKETRLIDNNHEIKLENNDTVLINADRKLLKEALRIFIDNSIKYTPSGGSIKVSCTSEKNNILLVVEDTGIGISKEELPYIFNRFYRADKSRTKDTGGTGLGLAIAKWIVFKHKGGIEVQSKLQEGTKITITLPAALNKSGK